MSASPQNLKYISTTQTVLDEDSAKRAQLAQARIEVPGTEWHHPNLSVDAMNGHW